MEAQAEDRFCTPLSLNEFVSTIDERIPQNTKYSTGWALRIWREWRTWRNFRIETMKDDHWPIPNLVDGDLKSLDYWLARFITEIRRVDCKPYPAGEYLIIFC